MGWREHLELELADWDDDDWTEVESLCGRVEAECSAWAANDLGEVLASGGLTPARRIVEAVFEPGNPKPYEWAKAWLGI